MLRHLPTGTRESLGERASWRSLGAFLPVLASGVFCFAFFDASILALLPLYGMDKGLNEGLAVLLVTVVLTGDAMFQTPLGWLADRVGIRRVHLSCAVVFSLSLLALPLMLGSRIQLMAICLLLGAAAGALYTLSLVRAGKTFNGQKLIMINALFGFFWSCWQRCRAGSQRHADRHHWLRWPDRHPGGQRRTVPVDSVSVQKRENPACQ